MSEKSKCDCQQCGGNKNLIPVQMQTPNQKTTSIKQQKEKHKRTTLNKLIARAPTRAAKWKIALHGGLPATKIQMLAAFAVHWRFITEELEDWQIKAKERLKQDFADLLFPALVNNDPAPFNELLEAMATLRREITFAKDGLVVFGNRPKPSAKKEAGRKLRLAILDLKPDDRVSIQAVFKFLESRQVEFSDESHVRRVMREMKIHLLQPGDTVYLGFAPLDPTAPTTGRPQKEFVRLRKFVVNRDRMITSFGMSREKYDALWGCKAHYVVPAATKPDK